ncbi:toll/interleukin-1 receptor domain-containing protein [Novosphingobium aquiterrae]|uniref:Toll/interleukin-1 receptor domain-containing protein n=1 Tax=Novosphingobium aquiterrae TaxID=624388 RepID=A0ABV6PKT0_9SPHN
MGRPGAEPDAPRYRAFISYSHANDGFAHWLHRRLERYVLPRGPETAAERLSPIFLDRAELAAGTDLSQQVRAALDASAALIVVCSPAAAQSRWVALEIELFRQLHPDRPILAALLAGEPADAFPAPLTHHAGMVIEPLAADFRKQGDGRRLGLLKVIAGLTALPLDRLVQRDAIARQRRVMVITAGAVVLSLVLAAMLFVALRERAEAQRQRADAEGMVEFMLTDLRDRLKGVGRLEIMDSVNRKAMEHYRADNNVRDLPDDMLQRRARLLTAMGEDDMEQGKRDAALEKFQAAYRVTDDLLKRDPGNTDRIFNHAQSEYWVGSVSFEIQDKPATQKHWQAYLALAQRLVAIEPAKIDWQRELGYAENNLCALALAEPIQPDSAKQHCSAAVTANKAIAAFEPDKVQSQFDYLNALGWEADAALKSGRGQEALTIRLQQRDIARKLPGRFPGDARALQANLQVMLGLAQTYAAIGQADEAATVAKEGLLLANDLERRDPSNKSWSNWRRKLMKLST